VATEAIAGMEPTGRRVTAPAAEVVELVNDKGLKHLAFVHAETFIGHPAVSSELQLGWMEEPDVAGLSRLVHHDPDRATFVYATGTCWTLSEVVRVYAEEGEGAGVKAGLELCYLVGEALADASESGVPQGVISHGNLNPWTVVLRPDGQPLVLGYGIPQVEILTWLDDARQVPREDSFRYAPPERLDGEEEDIASDLFTLALVGLELMMGRPVYDGLRDDIRQQASRGEGMRRLYQWRDKLPANVREVLGRALKPDPDTRFRSGLDFVYAVHDLLGSIDVEGPSLVEVMGRVRAVTKRGREPIQGGKTGTLSKEELAELAADLVDYEERDLPPPKKPRPEPEADPDETDEAEEDDAPRFASRVGRARQAEPEPEPEPDPRASVRERLRRRRRPSENDTQGQDLSARERLLRRLKEGREDGGSAGRRRLRRNAPSPERKGPRRRKRRGDRTSEASQSIDIGDPLGFDANQSQFPEEAEPTAVEPMDDAPPSPRPPRRPPREAPPEAEDQADDDLDDDEADGPADDAASEAGLAPVAMDDPPGPVADDEVATTVEPSPLRASGGAAALLERLRSSAGGRRSRRQRRSRSRPPRSEPPQPVDDEPELAAGEPAAAVPDPEPAVATPSPEPPDEPAPEAPPAPPQRSQEQAPAPEEPQETTRWEEDDGTGPLLVMGPAGSTAVPREAVTTVADLVGQAVIEQGLVEVDGTGQVVGWWCARQAGKPVHGHTPVGELAPTPLELEPVAEGIVRARVQVDGGPEVERLLARAVPAGWIVTHLVRQLQLSGTWALQVGGRALGQWELLAEHDLDEHGIVIVRR